MRTSVHLACLIALGCLLIIAWNHQFEPIQGGRTVGLSDLEWLSSPSDHIKHEKIGISLSAQGPNRHASLGLPLVMTSRYLHVRMRASSKKLIAGNEIWQDGRLFIEWLSPDLQRAEVSYLHSARGDSLFNKQFVIPVPAGNLRPVLQIQNLGKQGDYVIHQIEFTPARHTRLWGWGSLMISVASIILIAGLLLKKSGPSLTRRLLASSIAITFAYLFIIPGPWPKRVGIGQSLEWNSPSAKNAASTYDAVVHQQKPTDPSSPIVSSPQNSSLVTPPNTELPEPENLALRAKKALKPIRPLLHIALLFFPVWLVSYCAGARNGFLLGAMMAIAIEAGQWLFGYGFQADDIRDLLANLCGISLAVFCHKRLSSKIHARMPFPIPQPET